MNESITAWRVRWDLGAYDEMTSWSTNYDIMWEVMDDKYKAMPGADVRFEALVIDLSQPVPDFEIKDLTDDFPQWADLDETDLSCSTRKCENDPVLRRSRRLWCHVCADHEFDDMPWQRDEPENARAEDVQNPEELSSDEKADLMTGEDDASDAE